jgi:hypothetical protein
MLNTSKSSINLLAQKLHPRLVVKTQMPWHTEFDGMHAFFN